MFDMGEDMKRHAQAMTDKKRMITILDILARTYPDARVGLDYTTPFELLIATILSAQCTDERVNIVTKRLFVKYKSPNDYLSVSVEELESDIHSTGFYRNKARNIQGCCATLLDTYGGNVPETLEDLIALPGVGRKTANCVLSTCYGKPAITVDTHVTRVSALLGFTQSSNAEIIERDLMEITPSELWNSINLLFITHGRRICIARRPRCNDCAIADYCPSSQRD